MYGCDKIIKNELEFKDNFILPITIPHGIDFHQSKQDIDLHCHEPVYMAFRDDIAERVAKFKTVLKFPHPWLLIISLHKLQNGKGTLFIAPPPSQKNFESMLLAIKSSEHPKPWGVLMKDRDLKQEDFQWWNMRGFITHCAGSTSDEMFFYKLRDIFSKYESVASPNMSSAVIFAVAMNRVATVLPNILIETFDDFNCNELNVYDDTDGKIATVWNKLLSNSLSVARKQAEDLLGMKYLDDTQELRRRLVDVIAITKERPVHLFPLKNRLLYKFFIWLIKKNFPIQKIFPNPFSKIVSKLMSLIHLQRFSIIKGSDFSHYGVSGDKGKIKIKKIYAFSLFKKAKSGNAIRN